MSHEWKGDKHIKAAEKGKIKALTKAALVVHGQAVELAPIITGNLKNSISYSVDGKRHGLNSEGGKQANASEGVHTVTGDDAVIGTNVEYAARIEYGFKDTDSLGRKYDQAAQPYLEPAFEINRKNIKEILGDIIGKEIEGAGK